jgi:hypothetical protein
MLLLWPTVAVSSARAAQPCAVPSIPVATCTKPFILLNAMPCKHDDKGEAYFTPCVRVDLNTLYLAEVTYPSTAIATRCQRASASPKPGRVLEKPQTLTHRLPCHRTCHRFSASMLSKS